MELSEFTKRAGEWLSGEGPNSDVVISSRIRLARNLSEHLFLSRADERQKRLIAEEVSHALGAVGDTVELSQVDIDELDGIDRLLLLERHLISREHAFAKGARSVAFDAEETTSVMINEEDHLRQQVMRSGFQLEEAWQAMNRIDRQLEESLDFAFDDEYGYLTACPTNVGTGLRASVMLHLPALVMTRQIEKVFGAVTKINLAVRGLFGEGTQALGDFYQISNQRTLGLSEEEIVGNISSILPQIINFEEKVRRELLSSNREVLEDKVWRAFGTLSTARVISSKETMETLSLVRLGVTTRLIDHLEIHHVNELFLFTQPGHLQKVEGHVLESRERDTVRAKQVREYLEDLR
jgi:protein arginine kinase